MTAAPTRWISLQRAAAIVISPGDRALRAAAAKGARGQPWRGVVLKSRVVARRGGRDGNGNLELGLAELTQALPEHAETLAAAANGETAALQAPAKSKRGLVKRADWGRERLLFLRRLYKAADLPAEVQTEIEAGLHHEVCCLWAGPAGRAGWRRVATWASDFLYDLVVAQVASLPEAELRPFCRVPKSYVTRWERRKHRKTDTWLNDRKAFADGEPGVRRKRPDWPLDLLYGDGTALDIRVLRDDGGEWKVWLILWLDAATNRLFGHCYARPKGGGVKQQHVGLSLVCLATAFGMPRQIYIDRGSEYAKLKLLETAGLARVIQALPHGARAKAIESIIGVFMRQHISQIDGYLGSDRFAKPTETVGQPTTPFSGTMQSLFGKVSQAIDLYNAMPQDALGGRSPDAVWQEAVDRGWRRSRIDPEALTEALIRIETRIVKQGFITLDGVEYSCDALCRAADLEGERVAVHAPGIPGVPPSVFAPDGRFVGLVYEREWQQNDRAGAREAGRLKTLRRKGARELERTAPPADVQPYQANFLERHAPPADAPVGAVIDLSGERGKAVEARRQATALPATDLQEVDPRLARRRRLAGLPALPAISDRSS